ncbi:MAG: histidinol-phosphate aminotransferase [Alphaproteobacteria bacterium]|nr:histidinol-phosphate aminotransferase [Alphaproteobacteria bacterium]
MPSRCGCRPRADNSVSPIKPKPGILNVKPYEVGVSKLAGIENACKLSSNESALGPSPKAAAAYQAAAEKLHRYPDGASSDLRAAIAAHYGLAADRIICGNGSDELLHLLCQAYIGPGDEMVYSAHGFSIYPIATLAAGGKPVAAPERNHTAQVDALLACVTPATRILFLANPNNPTGTYVSATEVRRLRAGLRDDILLVLDAAYAEFVRCNDYEAGIEMVSTHDNVVMTRTYSKIYGLAALRLGWAYCPAHIIDVLNRVRGPFNVSLPAQAAGIAALQDTAFTQAAIDHNEKWRGWLEEELRKLGLFSDPSVANFLLVSFPAEPGRNAAAADDFLRRNGMIVRRMEGYGLPQCLRVTVGTEAENRDFIRIMTEFTQGKTHAG